MQRLNVRPLLFIGIFFFVILSLSPKTATSLRTLSVAALQPVVKPSFSEQKKASSENFYLLDRLKLENDLMRTQIESLQEWVLFEGKKNVLNAELEVSSLRRQEELLKRLQLHQNAVQGRVIFREPVAWSSHLWLDVGSRVNAKLGKEVIAKNSPVMHGSSLVGIVEKVTEGRCLVRLITDSNLVPSVRAVRGRQQYRSILQQLEALLTSLQLLKGGLGPGKEDQDLAKVMEVLKEKWQQISSDAFLAKGELHGSGAPLWRAKSNLLKGIGFNYDFADEEGPARELRSGAPLNNPSQKMPLLQVGDLLVTTGFDGVFPPNLAVAIVQEVCPLKEGAASYEIRALPAAGNLNHLETLFVLPPLEL